MLLLAGTPVIVTAIVDARRDDVVPSAGPAVALTPARAVLDLLESNSHVAGQHLPMALANGGFVNRQYTCSVDSIPGTCPGIAALKGREWDLGLAPTADVLLFGPSFMNQIAETIASFTHVMNDPIVAVDNLFEEDDLVSVLWEPPLVSTLVSTKQCNIRGTGDDCLWPYGAFTLSFRSGTRLTIIQNVAAVQNGSDGAAARLEDLLRHSTFNHVFYMCPHGKEYFAEQREAKNRTASEEKIKDAQGRNMCLQDGNGTEAFWGDYLECVTSVRSYQMLEHTLPSAMLSLVVPWMQAVPDGARAFGQPVISSSEEASAHGCEASVHGYGIGEGEPSEGPLGRVIHQCVVVCEEGDTLKAALEQGTPDGPCTGGSVALVAEKMVNVLRSLQR